MVVVRRNILDSKAILVHHGIKGQKWGVRRTPEELGHFTKKRFYEIIAGGSVVTKDGTRLTEFSQHAYQQSKLPERKVGYGSILDAVRNPLKITSVKYDSEGRPSQQYIGKKATAAVNPDTGVITSVWPTHTKLLNKLSR